MTRIGLGLLLTGTLALGGLVGCKHSLVDETWGEAQRENVARMIANPEAGQVQPETPPGLDAATAGRVMQNHRQTQGQQQAPSVPRIFTFGGGGGGGSQ